MRANKGFTLIELMVVVAIVAIVAGLVVWQGRSARDNARMAGGAYDLALRVGGLRARAMAEARDYVLVVADATNPASCAYSDASCGRLLVLRSPQPGFTLAGFSPDPPIAGAEWVEDDALPRNAQLDLPRTAATWRAPAPFAAVQAFEPTVMQACAGGRACFGLRFRANGDVGPVSTTAPATLGGFAFVLRPIVAKSGAAERRAVFVSFPAGLVKTAAF